MSRPKGSKNKPKADNITTFINNDIAVEFKPTDIIKSVLYDLFNKITILESKQNSFENLTHELLFQNLLIDSGFKVYEGSDIPKGSFTRDTKTGYFDQRYADKLLAIHHPYGSQASPDFILVVYGFIFKIELKSSKNGLAMWNSGYAQNEYIYIYSNTLLKYTTFFIGACIISPEVMLIFEQHIKDIKDVCDRTNSKLSSIGEHHWSTYPRVMFQNTATLAPKHEYSVFEFIERVVSYDK